MKSKIMDTIPALAGIVSYLLFLKMFHLPCPILYLTGCSCPGCGMSRAVMSASCFNFKQAFYYHPLFFVPFLGIYMYIKWDDYKDRTKTFLLVFFCSAMILVYIYRMVYMQSDVVRCDIQQGLLYKVFMYLKSLILRV